MGLDEALLDPKVEGRSWRMCLLICDIVMLKEFEVLIESLSLCSTLVGKALVNE